MGVAASSCMGRRGKYRVREPMEARNEFLPTVPDLGLMDSDMCVRYRHFEEIPPRGVAKDIAGDDGTSDGGKQGVEGVGDAVLGDTRDEGEELDAKWTGCHLHEPLPVGVEDAEVPHPDLPEGVTCITCAATMMEKGQEKGMGEPKSETTIGKGVKNAGEGNETREENEICPTAKCNGAVPSKEDPDGQDMPTNHWKGTEGQANRKQSNNISRGSRWRRRYNALDKAHPVVKSGVHVD